MVHRPSSNLIHSDLSWHIAQRDRERARINNYVWEIANIAVMSVFDIFTLCCVVVTGSSLKVVGTMSVGYDHIDLGACRERGIPVGFTPDVLTNATAELTVALLLGVSRRLKEGLLFPTKEPVLFSLSSVCEVSFTSDIYTIYNS